MPFDHNQVLQAQFQQLASERARAYADYENGRLAEDEYSTMNAANLIVEADAKLAALNNIANNYVAAQQQPQGNRYGLNPDEVQIAHGIAGHDPHITLEQRELVYAQNKQKLQHMRATGQYRDDQGRR